MLRAIVVSSLWALLTSTVWAGEADVSQSKAKSPAALQAEVEALKVAQPVWREISWKGCLIEGLKESREKNKPVLLWIFIDRPVDDARC